MHETLLLHLLSHFFFVFVAKQLYTTYFIYTFGIFFCFLCEFLGISLMFEHRVEISTLYGVWQSYFLCTVFSVRLYLVPVVKLQWPFSVFAELDWSSFLSRFVMVVFTFCLLLFMELGKTIANWIQFFFAFHFSLSLIHRK